MESVEPDRALCAACRKNDKGRSLLVLLTGSMVCWLCVSILHLSWALSPPITVLGMQAQVVVVGWDELFPRGFRGGHGVCLPGGCARRGLGLASASIPGVCDLSGGGGKGELSRSGTKTLTQLALLVCGSFNACKIWGNCQLIVIGHANHIIEFPSHTLIHRTEAKNIHAPRIQPLMP